MSSAETYQLGYHPSVVARHARRTVDTAAAFFMPFLKSGMRLPNVGCGPGSVTCGLAQHVAPGIDSSADVIATATRLGRDPNAFFCSSHIQAVAWKR